MWPCFLCHFNNGSLRDPRMKPDWSKMSDRTMTMKNAYISDWTRTMKILNIWVRTESGPTKFWKSRTNSDRSVPGDQWFTDCGSLNTVKSKLLQCDLYFLTRKTNLFWEQKGTFKVIQKYSNLFCMHSYIRIMQ